MLRIRGGFKAIQDGLILVGAYHFLLGVIWLLATIAIVVYAIIPTVSAPDPTYGVAAPTNTLFLPVVGLIAGLIMAGLYSWVGSGLIKMANWARMAAVFLAMFGIGGGLLGVIGLVAGLLNTLSPNWTQIATIGIVGLCVFFIGTIIDMVILVFLLNNNVQAVFYGEDAASLAASAEMPAEAVARKPGPGELPQTPLT